VAEFKALSQIVQNEFENVRFAEGISKILLALNSVNSYFQSKEPWVLARNKPDRAKLENVLFHSLECIRITAILLQPIMPEIMSSCLDRLNVPLDQRSFSDCAFRFDGVDSSKILPRDRWTMFPRLAQEV
jgi:methionyl-tRNA synthetase